MKRALAVSALGAAALAFSAACIMVMDPNRAGSWQPRGTFRKTVDFAAGGTLAFENEAGDVEIVGWDKDSVEIVAQASAAEPASENRRVRAYGFWEVKPDVEVQETKGGLTIRTRPFEGPGEGPVVDYSIKVPSSVVLSKLVVGEGRVSVSDVIGRVEVSLDKGDVAVANFSGSVDVAVGEGTADVEVLDLRDEDTIAIVSGKGDILLRLEPGNGFRVEAEAPRSQVRCDFDLGVKTPAARVSGRLGSGGAAVTLKAEDGRIEIVAVKDRPDGRRSAR